MLSCSFRIYQKKRLFVLSWCLSLNLSRKTFFCLVVMLNCLYEENQVWKNHDRIRNFKEFISSRINIPHQHESGIHRRSASRVDDNDAEVLNSAINIDFFIVTALRHTFCLIVNDYLWDAIRAMKYSRSEIFQSDLWRKNPDYSRTHAACRQRHLLSRRSSLYWSSQEYCVER